MGLLHLLKPDSLRVEISGLLQLLKPDFSRSIEHDSLPILRRFQAIMFIDKHW